MGFYQSQKEFEEENEKKIINDTIETIPYQSNQHKFDIVKQLETMRFKDPTIREIEADDRGFVIFIHNTKTTVNLPKHITLPH